MLHIYGTFAHSQRAFLMVIMKVKALLFILLLRTGIQSKEQFSCLNETKYLRLGMCIINDFDYDDLDGIAEDSFSNTTHLEFRGIFFPYFAGHMFELLPDTIRQLTFRDGYVREINLQSSSPIEWLRVINTDLVTLDAVSEPNHSLKGLTIWSSVFSRWSTSLQFMKALESIDVAYCNFTFLDLDWFQGYERLRLLDVSNNKLQRIASRMGLTFPALEELYIWGNQLEFVWRFPDAFPNLRILNLSNNLWRCSWVSLVREAIRKQEIVVIDSDYSCENGWVLNGGLCCQNQVNTKIARSDADSDEITSITITEPSYLPRMIEYVYDKLNGKVIGMRMGNSVVYLEELVSE